MPVTTSAKLDASTIVSVGNTVFRVQPKQPAPQAPAPTPAPSVTATPTPPPVSDPAPPPVNYKARALRQTVKSQIHDELVRRLDLKRLTAGSISADELAKRVRETLQAILDEVSNRGALPASIDPDDLVNEIYDESASFSFIRRPILTL